MGSALRVLTADAEYIRKKAQVEASRKVQAARNASETALAEARTKVRDANNAASLSFAESQRRVQTSNNAAARILTDSQRAIQTGSNLLTSKIMEGKLAVQRTFNEQAVVVAESRKVLQAARNQAAATGADVARWQQSLANQRMVKQAAKRISMIEEEIGLTLRGATSGRVFDRIAFAEAMGAAVNNAAAAGAGGGSLDDYNSAMQLRQDLKEASEDRALRIQMRAAREEQAGTLRAAYDGQGALSQRAQLDREVILADQDNTPIFDERDFSPIYENQDYSAIIADQDFSVFTPNLDFTVYEDAKKMSTFQKVATFVGAGVATYFGGPQAGNAVFDASMALYDANNGNFAAASAGMNNAMRGAYGGFQTYRAGNTQGGFGRAWGANVFGGNSSQASAVPDPAGIGQVRLW